MKTPVYFLLLALPLVGISQTAPVWTRNINALPDSSHLYPVKAAHDADNNIYVLSTYDKGVQPQQTKIYLSRYNETGALSWTYVYDDTLRGQPRAFDMAVDDSGYCYIAGMLMKNQLQARPFILKVSPAGTTVWTRDSTTAFFTGWLRQVILQHNLLYLQGDGIAVFNTNGQEKWSRHMMAQRIAVDRRGRMIVSATDTTNRTLFRFDSTGVLQFADSTISGQRIAIDANNNICLLANEWRYELVKYDSTGTFKWSYTAFPQRQPFGDISFEVLTDWNNDVIVTGLNDTMMKFTSSGTLIWLKTMQGLDSYIASSEIIAGNQLAIAGTVYNGTEYSIKAATYNSNGVQNWSGTYNGNSGLQEFEVSMAVDNSGLYVLENNNQDGTLVKFAAPFTSPIDYSLMCVDSIWYDTADSHFVHVRVYNGNAGHLNYPSLQIVSATGDTIGNRKNNVDFFAHPGNVYLTYRDSISTTGITNWSNYKFVIHEGFGVTTALIPMCRPTGLNSVSITEEAVTIYPNPFTSAFVIDGLKEHEATLTVFDPAGRKIFFESICFPHTVLRGNMASGIYFYTLADKDGIFKSGKLVAE